jgi:1,4-dihydroxy-2-naphthoate octaprenyltransferase
MRSFKDTYPFWLAELRAPFFTVTIVSVFLGAAVAWNIWRVFDSALFLLSLVGALCLHAGTNVINDYFDFQSGCDVINKEYLSPFSGGSRLLPDGVLEKDEVRKLALLFFGAAGSLGIYLALLRGWLVFVLGVVGILSGYFYTTKLVTKGLGELFVGLNFGPLMVLGSYYVQTMSLQFKPLYVSLPVGLLVAAILWVNQFPDYSADREVGKRTLVVVLGREKASQVFALIIVVVYSMIGLGILFGWMPVLSLVSFFTIPLAVKAVSTAQRYHSEPEKLAPACSSTILTHLVLGLLLTLAYVLGRN